MRNQLVAQVSMAELSEESTIYLLHKRVPSCSIH